MNWKNELTELLQIEYPIVQAPMLGVSSPAMAAAVSNEGGLGSLAVGGLSPEKTLELIRQTKALTDKIFAVNVFAHPIPPVDIALATNMQDYLERQGEANQLKFEKQDIERLQFNSYKEQIDILLQENIRIVSFTFGILDDESIQAFRRQGVVLIGSATCVKEARQLEEKDIDIICAQGIEAGGHRGSFLEDEALPQVGTLSLIPQVVDAVNKPVLAAGGIADGRGIRAAMILGAAGVQIGTAFIASPESVAIPAYKTALMKAADTDSILTRSFSGRWARGLRNKFTTEVEASEIAIPLYPIQNSLTTPLRRLAQQQNNKDFTNLWAGQSSYLVKEKPSAEIFRDLVREAERI